MPRIRRVPRIRRGWPPGAVEHLLFGHDFFGDAFGNGDDFDEESAEAAWFELRDRVFAALAERQRGCHGTYSILRPAAWWWFESAEPRDFSISEREQLDRMGVSCEMGEVPQCDGSDNGRVGTGKRLNYGGDC